MGRSSNIRLGSLDTLRGIAILLVVSFHTSIRYPQLAHGAKAVAAIENGGVQLFFLVSAFTMCMMWHARSGEPNPTLSFYLRRLCRIAPLYWLAIFSYRMWSGTKPVGDTIANVLLVHSFSPTAINSVVPGGWSIGVEIIFYVLFPALISLRPRDQAGVAIGWYLFCGIGAEALLAGLGLPDIFLYYSLLTQLPVFLVGIQVYLGVKGEGLSLRKTLALASIWLTIAFAARAAGLPGRPFFWVSIMGMAGITAMIVKTNFALRPLQFVGRLSYSMYLIHFAVIDVVVQFRLFHSYAPAFGSILSTTVFLSWISFRTTENWSQRLGQTLVKVLLRRNDPREVMQQA